MNNQPASELFEHVPDISFRVSGDIISLEQTSGCGEVERVDIHRIHIARISQAAGFIAGDEQLWRRYRDIEHRLKTLAGEVDSLFNLARGEPDIELDLMIWIRGVSVLAGALTADLVDGDQKKRGFDE